MRRCETCIHRQPADDAVSVDPESGRETPILVYLCMWGDANPERFLDAPRWLTERQAVIYGWPLDSKDFGRDCPGYKRDPALPRAR